MKMIEAVIKQAKLQEVKAALQTITIVDIRERKLICHGRQKRESILCRGAEYVEYLVKKVKIEIIAADESVGKIIEAIGSIARTERREDCRIFIFPFVETF